MTLLAGVASAGLLLVLLWPRMARGAPGKGVRRQLLGTLRRPGQDRWQQRQLEQEVPATLDLLCLALGAGTTVASSLRVVAERGPRCTARHFAGLVAELDTGVSLDALLRRLPDTIGSDYQPTVATLRTALTQGSPVGELILRLGDEARASRQRQLEKRARQLPVLLLFPLVGCSLPALIVGAVVPLVIVSL